MDEKAKNAQEIIDLTEKEKKQLVHMVNKMSTMYDFIRDDMHNTHCDLTLWLIVLFLHKRNW